MLKLGIFVGEDNWTFFSDIYKYLADHYIMEVYKRKVYDIPLLYGRLNRWSYRNSIRRMLRQNDICFFEWASEFLMLASNLPKGCYIVTRLHSFELYDWAPNINWDIVDKVILVSRAMQQKFIELYPDHGCKTIVINNGISTEKFKPSDKKKSNFNLGMLCNIVPIKRIYEIILMTSNLKELGFRFHLHVAGKPVGEARYPAAIHRLIDKLDLKDHVTFYGFVADTANWLRTIDIFISNSFWEGQPASLLEAMATGCYCLSHHWDGAEEVLPIENLYFDESELMQKIIDYYQKPSGEKSSCRANMRAIACSKFDIERIKMQIREVIEEASTNA